MDSTHYTNLSQAQQDEIARLSEKAAHGTLTPLEAQWLTDYQAHHGA